MKLCSLLLAAALAIALAVPAGAAAPPPQPKIAPAALSGWTTYHHDNTRNGYDAAAPAFTGGPFSQWDKAVDADIYAEPLAISGRVYVATMGDSVYAFDANSGNQVWARTGASALGSPGPPGCGWPVPMVGIMGTPVIDPSTNILYAVGLVNSPSNEYRMFALHLADGSNVSGFPVDLSTDPTYQNQRSALALANGHVYVTFGGWNGDCGTYHPIVLSVPTTGGAEDHSFAPQSGCMNAAGIWGPSGPAVDGSGNVYVATGNGNGCYGSGSFPCTNASWDYSEGVFKLSSTLGLTSSWAPDNSTENWCTLNGGDTDIGSIGPALLPNNEIFQTGKPGYGWLLNTASLGGFDGQQFQGQIGACSPDATFGGLAYYSGRVYVPCDGVGLVAFSVNTVAHTFNTTPDWVQNVNPGPPIAAMGLIWDRDQGGNHLYGFDPSSGNIVVDAPLGGGSNHFGTLAEDGGVVFVPHGSNIRAFNFFIPPCNSTSSTNWKASCSYGQYTLTNTNGSTWMPMDTTKLQVTFTPTADSYAVLSGNVDLWTSNAGYNQDVGIGVSGPGYPITAGQPEAWKESGGGATYSPNAAFVQTVIPVAATQTYTASLQWKASRADPGTIWAGAGPIVNEYSPARITAMLVPVSAATVFKAPRVTQYSQTGSNGTVWKDVDTTNLTVSFTPPAGTWRAFVSGNADLWTSSAGYNQDLGVSLTGPGFPTAAGQPEAWKESGGSGTYSPNAAFVQTSVPVTAGQLYTARLVWKSNRNDPGTIWAGAGPILGHFSPTSISVILIPTTVTMFAPSVSQYTYNTNIWQPIDMTNLKVTITPGSTSNYLFSGNADLWTEAVAYNQDIGIMVSGGGFGTNGTLISWKESGGSATFSPNAAFVFADVTLPSGATYTIWLAWKTSRPAVSSVTIHAGAGPVNGHFSPTSLSAVLLN